MIKALKNDPMSEDQIKVWYCHFELGWKFVESGSTFWKAFNKQTT